MKPVATMVGLCLSLGGPLLLFSPLASILGEEGKIQALIASQLFLWALAFAMLALVLMWEEQPLSSVGLFRPGWQSVLLGLLTAAFLLYLVTPLASQLVVLLKLSGFETGLSRLQGLSIEYLIFAGVTAGIVEELLYRGYPVERLSELTGNVWMGGLLAVTAFALVHIPFWGTGPAVFTLFPGIVLTLLYIWRRDLTANMIAHSVTAFVQLAPLAGADQ